MERLKRIGWTSAAVIAAASVSTAMADTVTLQAGVGGQPGDVIEEAMLVQESSNDNFGGRTDFEVGVPGNSAVRTTVMRFDVLDPTVGLYAPNGAALYSSIDAIKLTLTATNTNTNPGNMDVRVSAADPLQGDWVEGTGTTSGSGGDAGNVTYSERQEGGGTGWSPNTNYTRGTGDGLLGSQATYPGLGSTFDITFAALSGQSLGDLTQRWATGDNEGVLINDVNRSGFARWIMASSENATLGSRPALEVTYTAANLVNARTVALGNLFDDNAGTGLDAAIASDTYGASAATTDLGIETVIQGNLNVAQTIAPGVSFNLGVNAGGGSLAANSIAANDTRRPGENIPLRTTGTVDTGLTSGSAIEDGIGIHANGLVTFDLDDLRAAGNLSTFASYFTAKGALNDTSSGGDVNAIAIVSDGAGNVLGGWLNGQKIGVTNTAGTWTFDAASIRDLDGSGAERRTEFAFWLAPEARYLTLAGTSNGGISSDHVAFVDSNWESAAIPLSNLFGDSAGTSLADAIISDPRGQAAASADRFVDVALNGGMSGNVTIGGTGLSEIVFNLTTVGGGANGAGFAGNDTRRAGGAAEFAIQTRGLDNLQTNAAYAGTTVIEDGIGMHANSLVTFDLAEIRVAGDLAFNQEFIFRARGGIGDTAGTADDLRTVFIVSDGEGNVLAALINGIVQSIAEAGGVWSVTGSIPGEETGNTFVDYDVFLAGNARFLTLATTSGDISSDHGVFSGARLVLVSNVPAPAALPAGLALIGMIAARRRR